MPILSDCKFGSFHCWAEITGIVLLSSIILGSCVYVEKKNNESYQACLKKAARVTDCEAIK